jgi:hypothetical protein
LRELFDFLAARGPGGPPATQADWKRAVRERILTARQVLLRHRWAPALISAHGTMGPEIMRYFDEFGGTLAAGGFDLDTIHHALHAFGPRALGFSPELFELEAPAVTETELDEEAALADMAAMAEELPFLARMAQHLSHEASTTLGWCDDRAEFEFGLDVMLDGLEKRLNS